jgi:histone chaperone ASF1
LLNPSSQLYKDTHPRFTFFQISSTALQSTTATEHPTNSNTKHTSKANDTMATVSLLNVSVRNNPAAFSDPYEFEITFECLEPLQKDLEWKLTYVGSATS